VVNEKRRLKGERTKWWGGKVPRGGFLILGRGDLLGEKLLTVRKTSETTSATRRCQSIKLDDWKTTQRSSSKTGNKQRRNFPVDVLRRTPGRNQKNKDDRKKKYITGKKKPRQIT